MLWSFTQLFKWAALTPWYLTMITSSWGIKSLCMMCCLNYIMKKSGKELKAGTEWETPWRNIHQLTRIAQPGFLYNPKSPAWEALLKVGWVLPYQSLIKKAQVCLEMPLMEAFFSAEVSSSLMTLACIKMAEKLASILVLWICFHC